MLVPGSFSDRTDRAIFLAFLWKHSSELRTAYYLVHKRFDIPITWEEFIGSMIWHEFCS